MKIKSLIPYFLGFFKRKLLIRGFLFYAKKHALKKACFKFIAYMVAPFYQQLTNNMGIRNTTHSTNNTTHMGISIIFTAVQ